MNFDITSFLLILIGFWFGCGIAPVLILWIKNPTEIFLWKALHTIAFLLKGPISYTNIKYWVR